MLFALLTEKIIELDTMEAELAKLFCNSWRYVVFAVANQFYSLCAANGIDYYRIWDAVTRRLSADAGLPKAGFAQAPPVQGHDAAGGVLQQRLHPGPVSHAGKRKAYRGSLMQQLRARDLKSKTVAILGMAFKGDNDDTRESLAFKMKKLWPLECKKVIRTDPYVRGDWLVSLEEALETADLIVIGAPHSVYKRLNPAQPTLDPWNHLGRGGILT